MAWANGGVGSNIPARVKRIVRHRQANQCNTIDPNICTGEIQEFDHIAESWLRLLVFIEMWKMQRGSEADHG